MDIPVYQIDAFTDRLFGGNPAAVCPLDTWLEDELLQSIAAENNLSETAFFVVNGNGGYDLRWFTPGAEVDLCGHATLATASLLMDTLTPDANEIRFETRSGTLTVVREDDLLVMDFPVRIADEIDIPDGFTDAIGVPPVTFLRAIKNMAVFETEGQVRAVTPDFDYIADLQGMGLIITAPGDASDCASRYFAPQLGIDEDPVTGSAHCTIVPYWAARLGKNEIHARQVSARGGDLFCQLVGNRVRLGGRTAKFLSGRINLP